MALQQPGDAMAPYATPILERLVPVLQSPRGAVPSSLVDNSAITLGRVRPRCQPLCICPPGPGLIFT